MEFKDLGIKKMKKEDINTGEDNYTNYIMVLRNDTTSVIIKSDEPLKGRVGDVLSVKFSNPQKTLEMPKEK